MQATERKARVIALYLPQFHPIPENDTWWGKGFTEWTNVARARPLFRGHYQPRVPADLGFYDLRLPETRQAQADMAREHGIEAFCYWHYWFAGRRIIERPFTEVLKSGHPEFSFCLGWANQSWTGIWHGSPDRVLIEQTYPGMADHESHFYVLLEAFSDDRYLRVAGRPLLYIFQPQQIPELRAVADFWRELAQRAGLPGLYLVGAAPEAWMPQEHGFDASVPVKLPPLQGWEPWWHPVGKLRWRWKKWRRLPTVYHYEDAQRHFVPARRPGIRSHPCVVPNWDNTPRSGMNGLVLDGSTPELFRDQLRRALAQVAADPGAERLVFIKSWNEWAEGNHLEPDLRFGRGYLEVLRDELSGGSG